MSGFRCWLYGHMWTLAYLTGFEAGWECHVCGGRIAKDQAGWQENRPEPHDVPDKK